jgi:hypothetical protein
VISTAQGALEKQFQRVLNGLRLRTPLDNDPSGTTLHVPLVALAVGGLSESPRLIRLNASQLRQLFLIGSTIQYTDKEGQGRVACHVHEPSPTASRDQGYGGHRRRHRFGRPVPHPRSILPGRLGDGPERYGVRAQHLQPGRETDRKDCSRGYPRKRITLSSGVAGAAGRHRRGGGRSQKGKRIISLQPGTTGASHLNRQKPMEELAGARTCITTERVRRASRKGQRAGCRDVSNLPAATYLDELASASYGRAGGCAPHPDGKRKGWQNCSSKRLSVWFSACRGVSTRYRSARTHIVPARSIGKHGLAARCRVTIRRSPASIDRGKLPAESMATLPEKLRNKPIDALILLDPEQSMRTVSSNLERDAACGAALVDRAARFAYIPILHPAQTCITNDAGG